MDEAKVHEIRAWLTPYAVASRYPGDLPELTEEEAQKALVLARQMWDFILQRLPSEVKD